MVRTQRYVSEQLTHFVGRGLASTDEQFELLTSIVEAGVLLHPTFGGSSGVEMFEFPLRELGANERFLTNAVCFCDIPEPDLEIHMAKYSRFGLAFLRAFVVSQGGSPVFYVADCSPVIRGTGRSMRRDEYFSKVAALVRGPFAQVIDDVRRTKGASPELTALLEIEHWVTEHVLSFLKFFDPRTADADPANFYLEREWRVMGPVRFELTDVVRLFLPRAYMERFGSRFPGYSGQVSFSA